MFARAVADGNPHVAIAAFDRRFARGIDVGHDDDVGIAEAGGEVLVRGGPVHPVEGGWAPARIVVIAFSSVEQARGFYDGERYRQARQARAQAAHMRLVIAEGVGP